MSGRLPSGFTCYLHLHMRQSAKESKWLQEMNVLSFPKLTNHIEGLKISDLNLPIR